MNLHRGVSSKVIAFQIHTHTAYGVFLLVGQVVVIARVVCSWVFTVTRQSNHGVFPFISNTVVVCIVLVLDPIVEIDRCWQVLEIRHSDLDVLIVGWDDPRIVDKTAPIGFVIWIDLSV